jgi:hypothetical protein
LPSLVAIQAGLAQLFSKVVQDWFNEKSVRPDLSSFDATILRFASPRLITVERSAVKAQIQVEHLAVSSGSEFRFLCPDQRFLNDEIADPIPVSGTYSQGRAELGVSRITTTISIARSGPPVRLGNCRRPHLARQASQIIVSGCT